MSINEIVFEVGSECANCSEPVTTCVYLSTVLTITTRRLLLTSAHLTLILLLFPLADAVSCRCDLRFVLHPSSTRQPASLAPNLLTQRRSYLSRGLDTFRRARAAQVLALAACRIVLSACSRWYGGERLNSSAKEQRGE